MSPLNRVWTNRRCNSLSASACPESHDAPHRRLEQLLVLGEELLGHGSYGEGLVLRSTDVLVLVSPVDHGDLLNGGAERQVPLEDDAADPGVRDDR